MGESDDSNESDQSSSDDEGLDGAASVGAAMDPERRAAAAAAIARLLGSPAMVSTATKEGAKPVTQTAILPLLASHNESEVHLAALVLGCLRQGQVGLRDAKLGGGHGESLAGRANSSSNWPVGRVLLGGLVPDSLHRGMWAASSMLARRATHGVLAHDTSPYSIRSMDGSFARASAVIPDGLEAELSPSKAHPSTLQVACALLGLQSAPVARAALVGHQAGSILRFASFLQRAQQLEQSDQDPAIQDALLRVAQAQEDMQEGARQFVLATAHAVSVLLGLQCGA